MRGLDAPFFSLIKENRTDLLSGELQWPSNLS
ncbi:hypothetical protein GECvBN6_gp096c [Salmonella phage GEC_vB_N6]|nr:hypothetical protein GECvBN6_gp096c [Salmonella phage GEC_vB_N6]WDS51157.1 hypothetical protein SeF3a_074 [Salmonella phage SeF3a]